MAIEILQRIFTSCLKWPARRWHCLNPSFPKSQSKSRIIIKQSKKLPHNHHVSLQRLSTNNGLHGATPVPAEVVLHRAGVIMDEIRSMAATFEDVSQVMSRIASRPVSTAVLEISAADMKALIDTCQSTCNLCCHFRNHPPICQLTKRPISPRQFSCKKYSLKYNPHK